MNKHQTKNKRKRTKNYFLVKTFSTAFILLASFSVLSVGFSAWTLGLDTLVEEQANVNVSSADVIDIDSLITYYDGNYQIPEVCADGFVVDETIVYTFDISFEFRLRIKNVSPNRGLEYYLGDNKSFTLKTVLTNKGAFQMLNTTYLKSPPVTLKVKLDTDTTYTSLAHDSFDSTSSGLISANFTYTNSDILNISNLDFILSYHFQFSKGSHFSDNLQNVYNAITSLAGNSKIIALENQMFIEV